MNSVLLVEDSKLFSCLLIDKFEQELDIPVIAATDLASAERVMNERRDEIFLAVLDITLPDSNGLDIVELARAKKIPTIVFTGTFCEKKRDDIFSLDVIDYVTKDSPASIDYLGSIVRRIYKNQYLKALVIDDSRTTRMLIRRLLEKYQLSVIEADSAEAGLDILTEHDMSLGNEISIVITDFNMPKMNGDMLTRQIRQQWPPNELAVIGVSAQEDNSLPTRFIKRAQTIF